MFRKQLNEKQQKEVEAILEKILRQIADNSDFERYGTAERLYTKFPVSDKLHDEIDYIADLLGLHL